MEKIYLSIEKQDACQRLDRFLKKKYSELSQSLIEKSLRKGDIKLNGTKQLAKYYLAEGDVITVPNYFSQLDKKQLKEINLTPKKINFWLEQILYENEDLLIVNKPINVAVQGGVGIIQSIDDILPVFSKPHEERPKLVHRLDKETSGVLVIAKNRLSAMKLTEMFAQKQINKQYLAVICGDVEGCGKINQKIWNESKQQEQEAITRYEVLDNLLGRVTLIRLMPLTGRKHQLRIHCADYFKAPILGDYKHGGDKAYVEGFDSKLHLHAEQIEFKYKNELIKVKAPLTNHFLETLSRARFTF